jgi:hypothetical protein
VRNVVLNGAGGGGLGVWVCGVCGEVTVNDWYCTALACTDWY